MMDQVSAAYGVFSRKSRDQALYPYPPCAGTLIVLMEPVSVLISRAENRVKRAWHTAC